MMIKLGFRWHDSGERLQCPINWCDHILEEFNVPAIFHIARFTILEAWRTHFALLLLMVIIAGVGLSAFMTSQAITETETIRISILAASLRLLSVFVLSIYVISSFVREINDKGMELTLALPITRAQYLFGKFLRVKWIPIRILKPYFRNGSKGHKSESPFIVSSERMVLSTRSIRNTIH